jgi:hypothetical protein
MYWIVRQQAFPAPRALSGDGLIDRARRKLVLFLMAFDTDQVCSLNYRHNLQHGMRAPYDPEYWLNA